MYDVNDLDTSIKKSIISTPLKYFYEFGPDLALRYRLEKEIGQINRVIELYLQNQDKYQRDMLNNYYKLVDKEYGDYSRKACDIMANIDFIRHNLDELDYIEPNKDIEPISESIYLLDPSNKDLAEKLKTTFWPRIDTRSIKNGMDSKDLGMLKNFNDKHIFLPSDMIISTRDELSIRKKKTELKNINSSLKDIKKDLEYLLLSLQPESLLEQ